MQENKGAIEDKALYHEHREKEKHLRDEKIFLLIFWKWWNNFQAISDRWEGVWA